jgi:DNA polymerase-3 subunit delta
MGAMGALTLEALLGSLTRGAPAAVYYLHGDEDLLKDEAVQALVARAVEPGARDFNVDQRAAAELDPATLRALVDTPPLLAARRVVVLRGVEQLKKTSRVRAELSRYLDAPNPTTVLVLVQGAGEPPDPAWSGRAVTVVAAPLSPAGMARRLRARAAALGLTVAPEAAALLLEAAGGELAALERELDKLAALAAGRGSGAVTRDDVAALVGGRHGETLGEWVAAALERRPAAAARLVEPVLEQPGMSGVRMVTALGTALLGTALARAELERGTPRARLERVLFAHLRAARPFGLGDWGETAARWARWAERWPAGELRRALRLARDADRALKASTLADERGILMQLVLELAVLEREAA